MRLKHPITRADYARNDNGTVTVSGRSGGTGTFDRKGRWIDGELRIVDPLMCMFVSDGFTPRPTGEHAMLDAAINAEGTTA